MRCHLYILLIVMSILCIAINITTANNTPHQKIDMHQMASVNDTTITNFNCASCVKEGGTLNTCNTCNMVKYCNAACKKKHRSKHKKACEKELQRYTMKLYSKSIHLVMIVQFVFYHCHFMHARHLSNHAVVKFYL